MIPQALGGIGLFLIGMVLVTDGLRAAAGDSLRRFLLRFTGGPIKALLSGAGITALVQSSSATTLATIGFVGAGLITFEQSLGLIFGANVGTTATGWIVALLGLKFSVSAIALPLVGVGALTNLLARGRLAHFGLALAGFGIIFVGLDVLQVGMAALSEVVSPRDMPSDTLGGRLLLLGIGVVMTAVMQSSSAAVATTLTALHSGTISLEQAAAMVIGVNIGTTVTAGIAAIGASTAAKRTAFAHLLFNAFTGTVAFALLPAFVWAIERLGERIAPGDSTILLAGFHTAFNLVGVALILPFSARFGALVVRTIRERGPHLTRLLDARAARHGSVATEAVRQTALDIAREVFRTIEILLTRRRLTSQESERLDAAAAALRATEEYLGTLQFAVPLSTSGHHRHVSTIHALDHLGRLVASVFTVPELPAASHAEVARLDALLAAAVVDLIAWTADLDRAAPVDRIHQVHETVTQSRERLRGEFLAGTAAGTTPPRVANAQLEHLRVLELLARHLWRLTEHLRGDRLRASAEVVATEGV